jgi:hypothetical protein
MMPAFKRKASNLKSGLRHAVPLGRILENERVREYETKWLYKKTSDLFDNFIRSQEIDIQSKHRREL